MNLPSGELSCPDRPFRLSDSVSDVVCLDWACMGRESLRRERTETARTSFFKRAPPGDVTLSDERERKLVSLQLRKYVLPQFGFCFRECSWCVVTPWFMLPRHFRADSVLQNAQHLGLAKFPWA